MTHVIKFTLKVVCRASWRSGPQEIRIRPHRMENSSGRGAVTGHLLEAERDQAEDGPDKGVPWVSRKSPVSTAELPFALHPWTHWYSLPRTPQTCFQEPDSMSSFLTDSAKQQGTDLLRGLAPGLRLCHGGSAALSALQFPCSPPPPPPWVLWLQFVWTPDGRGLLVDGDSQPPDAPSHGCFFQKWILATHEKAFSLSERSQPPLRSWVHLMSNTNFYQKPKGDPTFSARLVDGRLYPN